MRRVLPLAALLMAATAVAVWTSRPALSPSHVVRVAEWRHPTSALLRIAESDGRFREEGLAVEFVAAPYGAQAIDAVLAGEADIAVATDFAFAGRLADAPDIRIVATIASFVTGDVLSIVGLGDRGAPIAGDRIRVASGALSDYLLDGVLAADGVPADAVERVAVAPERIAEALAHGEIDSAVVVRGEALALRAALSDRLTEIARPDVHRDPGDEFSLIALGVRAGWAADNAPALRAFLRALRRAQTTLDANPARLRRILRADHGFDGPALDDAARVYMIDLSLPRYLLPAMESKARWLERRRRVARRPDLRAAIDPAHLRAVDPRRVGAP